MNELAAGEHIDSNSLWLHRARWCQGSERTRHRV